MCHSLLMLAFGVGLLAAGCSSNRRTEAHTSVTAPPMVTGYPPTDPARIELIPWAPSSPYRRLGEITLIPGKTSTRAGMDSALRESAAALGAHAVFIVSDPGHRFEGLQVDVAPEERQDRFPTNGIVAIAIRYQGAAPGTNAP